LSSLRAPPGALALAEVVALAALGVGFLCTRPERGPLAALLGDSREAASARRFLPISGLGPLIGGLLLSWSAPEMAGRFAVLAVFAAALSAIALAGLSRLRQRQVPGLSTITVCDGDGEGEGAEPADPVEAELARLGAGEARCARLQAVVEQMPAGVIVLDASGRVLSESRVARQLTCGDTGRVDPFGNPVHYDLRTPTDQPVEPTDLPLARALRTRAATGSVELLAHATATGEHTILASAAPVLGDRGELLGAVGVFEDISPRKQLERLREEWAIVVAHDLRQPVAVIRLAADALVGSANLAPQSREHKSAARIRRAVQRLDKMISDLLDVTRIEARQLKIHRRPIDLGQLTRECVDAVRGAAPGRVIRVVEAGVPLVVWADAGRVEQVLGNLLSNALKYGAPATEVRVTLTARGPEIEVAVENRGAPIPADELPGLFDRFVRSRAARASAAEGLGLGLFAARGLVEAHGGRLWAESDPEATVFRFVLPVGPPERPDDDRPTWPPHPEDLHA
jgi:signal transduction histidine kinase